MEKNEKNTLKGMEHLTSELESNEENNKKESDVSRSNSIIKGELIQILLITLLLFGSIVAIVIIDNNTGFLQNLAEIIDNWT